jgi:hypothetical protein
MTMPHIVAQYLSDFAAVPGDHVPQTAIRLPEEEPRAAA